MQIVACVCKPPPPHYQICWIPNKILSSYMITTPVILSVASQFPRALRAVPEIILGSTFFPRPLHPTMNQICLDPQDKLPPPTPLGHINNTPQTKKCLQPPPQ